MAAEKGCAQWDTDAANASERERLIPLCHRASVLACSTAGGGSDGNAADRLSETFRFALLCFAAAAAAAVCSHLAALLPNRRRVAHHSLLLTLQERDPARTPLQQRARRIPNATGCRLQQRREQAASVQRCARCLPACCLHAACLFLTRWFVYSLARSSIQSPPSSCHSEVDRRSRLERSGIIARSPRADNNSRRIRSSNNTRRSGRAFQR